MEGTHSTDSDTSITWEDFFGSTTDLAPTLLDIYDSLLVPKTKLEVIEKKDLQKVRNANVLHKAIEPKLDAITRMEADYVKQEVITPKVVEIVDNRNDFSDNNARIEPVNTDDVSKRDLKKYNFDLSPNVKRMETDDVKQEVIASKPVQMVYGRNDLSDNNTRIEPVNTDDVNRRDLKKYNFDLSPNVRRMISTTGGDTALLKQGNRLARKAPSRKQTNIPLVGMTSKLTRQAPGTVVKTEDSEIVYDVPVSNKKVSEPDDSLPYIDQASEFPVQKEQLQRTALLVPRPLSLSSLASSSSTSSGGQPRPGANSAYLASIESLDDHSDAEVEHREKMDEQDLDASRGRTQLELVCEEIIHTEKVYVEDLRQVVVGYLHAWREEGAFSDEELDALFTNIEDIYMFNKSFSTELSQCNLEGLSIAQCFARHTQGFNVYTTYCTSYPVTISMLVSLACGPRAHILRETQVSLGHPLPLNAYLLKPVQRIQKYQLLLQKVVKHCRCSETEYALAEMTRIAQNINAMKEKHENAVRVQEIQSLLYGWTGADLTTYGELCAEGTFRVFGAKAERHVFLFDKMLLLTKSKEDGILAYKSHIMCNNLMLVETLDGAPLCFQVIPYDSPRGQVTLLATSLKNKRDWTLLLKRVMLESHHAAIPERAVQLVMELGQNKTDDDILAEKSHQRNHIINASIRKQMSAPIYLENRKNERERRKNFGWNKKYASKLDTRQETCGCVAKSEEDITCDQCYVEFCDRCDQDATKDLSKSCQNCDQTIHFIDSSDNLSRNECYKCDINSSQESFHRNRSDTRDFHSADNLTEEGDLKNGKTCLKCEKIVENIVSDDLGNRQGRRKCIGDDRANEGSRSRSKDDPGRSKLSKISGWRRKSEPGFQQNENLSELVKKSHNKVQFQCKNCGSTKIVRSIEVSTLDRLKEAPKLNKKYYSLDIKMYNSKNIPKRVSKLRKNKAKNSKAESKFYTDFDTTDNVLHITESNESLDNLDEGKDLSIDDVSYRKLIEKTDSFKKNELEKEKYLNNDDNVEEIEKPLEQIISQLLMQNGEFQKMLKKQQINAQRRQNRLLKSYSTPSETIVDNERMKPAITKQISDSGSVDNAKHEDDEPIYETLRVDPVKHETDYVYLSFDKAKKEEVIYDVPINTKMKKIEEVTKNDPTEPEIWLTRQKEHFATQSERKSGSLPRSFQVTNNASTTEFVAKSNGTKSYICKDGKVLTNERPFTIASDKSEIIIDRFDEEDISKSTLELQNELDRCFKSKFHAVAKETVVVENNEIDTSFNSSSEAISPDNTQNLHPEHKIYKSSTNGLSLKNVFSKFKAKASKKNSLDSDNDNNGDIDKKAVINSRHHSRTLLQRLKTIMTDENEGKLKVINTEEQLTKSLNVDSDKTTDEFVSKSCENLKEKPIYDRSISVQTKTTSNSGFNRLPIYKQGSKHLGARIAQSEYVDPNTIMDKNDVKNVNVLINKNAVRPDSMFSNCSTSCEHNNENDFYEKSFEKIESYIDDDTTYSEHDDKQGFSTESNQSKSGLIDKHEVTTEAKPKDAYVSKLQKPVIKIDETKTKPAISEKPKVKPKPFPSNVLLANPNFKSNLVKREHPADRELKNNHPNAYKNNVDTCKTNKAETNINRKEIKKLDQHVNRANKDVTASEPASHTELNCNENKDDIESQSIQMKRLSFERASVGDNSNKTKNSEIPKFVTKTVSERRKELEILSADLTRRSFQRRKVQPISPTVKSSYKIKSIRDETTKDEGWVKQVVNKFE